ncbi:MAG: Dabb family protein [Lachnospiraceae bacterium]|nr:Dabb family protein [Lachnospiraceae bacterium]
MVKHVILWKLKEEYSDAEKSSIKEGIKQGLEGLKGKIDGLIDIKVNIEPLPSSNCDLMLDSSFTDAAALNGYSVHPAHVEVANTKVRPYTSSRVCMDYEV